MRRILMLGILTSILLCSLSSAHAFQVCWRLQDGLGNPLLDLLRCSGAQDTATSPTIFPVGCSQEADPLYHAVGSGSATQDVEIDFTKLRMGLSMTHTAPGFFGNNRVCALTAILNFTNVPSNDPTFLGGTWTMQCSGAAPQPDGDPTPPFTVAGLIKFLPCPVSTMSLAQAQKDVGAQQANTFGEPMAAGIGGPTLDMK